MMAGSIHLWTVAVLLSASVSSLHAGPQEMAFPGREWAEAQPQGQGVDPRRLAEAIEYLRQHSGRDGVRELVIVRNGRLIHTGDNIDKQHGVWSVTKSFTSTVLGLLIEDGKASLDTRAAEILPEMKMNYPDVTLRHFTTMTSGYRAQGDEPRSGYLHGPSTTPFAPDDEPLFAAGTKYAYWDSAMNQFGHVLTRIAGEPIEELFKRRIADPIGMDRRKWNWGELGEVDGIAVNGGSGNSNRHIFISAREIARLGHLFLNRGFWAGRQLLSPAWVDMATRVQVPTQTPLGHPESGIDGRGVYGFNWWVNGVGANGKRLWPGAPAGTYAASGHNNNKMFVIPEWNMVIVRLGLDQADGRISNETWGTFLAKVGEAIVKFQGPLRVHPGNGRYFTDDSGRTIYLTGSHVWNNLVDMGLSDPPEPFDYDAYLDWLVDLDHNFFRLWRWELTHWNTKANRRDALLHVAPHPWARTGPGKALDGKPRFDLTQFNDAYFDRLRQRVEAAGNRGLYVAVMLFEGWGLQFVPGAWEAHPFHPGNNINGIAGDANGDGKGVEIHTLTDPKVQAIQERYIRKVIDTLNDLDNVLFEISNENHPASTEWQYHMIRFIRKYETGKPKQHPVGMTFQYKGGRNADLFQSPAQWVSPNPDGGYRDNPPAADGGKVVITDTDHLWGIGGNQAWVWMSFTRGLNPIFMDPYDGQVLGNRFDGKWNPIRRSLGYTWQYARRMDLSAMTPNNGLASTGFCLAAPGREYLVFRPASTPSLVQIKAEPGRYVWEWFDPSEGVVVQAGVVDRSAETELTCPLAGDAVLYLRQLVRKP